MQVLEISMLAGHIYLLLLAGTVWFNYVYACWKIEVNKRVTICN